MSDDRVERLRQTLRRQPLARPYPGVSGSFALEQGEADLDSLARNHNRKNARAMADRWDSRQCPARWHRVDQLELEMAG